MYSDMYDRILGSLVGAGMGDAMGAPSESMSRIEIIQKFGSPISTFLDPGENPYCAGNMAGEVTDDTTQMYEMAKAVIKSNGELSVSLAAKALVDWSKNYPKYYPRNAGPTTSHVIQELINGEDPTLVGMKGLEYGRGVSNGAAMRIASAGLINPGNLKEAVQTAVNMTKPSHATQHGFAGACAIACGIARAMVSDSDMYSILEACIYGAREGENIGIHEGRIASGCSIMPKLFKAIEIAISSTSLENALIKLEYEIGTDGIIQTTVPVAIGIFAIAKGDPKMTIIGGANVGGDTDTIACIAGKLAGAYKGYSSLPSDWKTIFFKANPNLDFENISLELLKIAQLRSSNE